MIDVSLYLESICAMVYTICEKIMLVVSEAYYVA